MSDLRSVIRIKTMAAAAADIEHVGPEQGDELAKAYNRLRAEACGVSVRAGWGTADDFDVEIPPIASADLVGAPRVAGRLGGHTAYDAVSVGLRAKVLLGQLAAWAAGHQETFELEAQMKANAEARARADTKPRDVGFRG